MKLAGLPQQWQKLTSTVEVEQVITAAHRVLPI